MSTDCLLCSSRYPGRIFFLSKVLWEHYSIDFFFQTRKFFSFDIDPMEVPISKFVSLRWKTFLYDSLETREFLWVKTHMGIQLFEVNFRAIFFSSRESIESWSKLAINQIAYSSIIAYDSDCLSLIGTTFFLIIFEQFSRSTPKKDFNCILEANDKSIFA